MRPFERTKCDENVLYIWVDWVQSVRDHHLFIQQSRRGFFVRG